MLKTVLRTAALGASALGLLVMTGCSAPNGQDAPPPRMATQTHAEPSPDLLGGPPAPPAQAAAAVVAAQRTFPTMAPIANPTESRVATRAPAEGTLSVYGAGYGHPHHLVAHEVAASTAAPLAKLAGPVAGTAAVAQPAPAAAPVQVAAASTSTPAIAAASATAAHAAPATVTSIAPSVAAHAPRLALPNLHLVALSLPTWLAIPGVPHVQLPGVAQPVASQTISAALILFIALVLLVLASRGLGSNANAAKRKAAAGQVQPTAGASEPAPEPAALPVAHDGPSFQADDFGGAHAAAAAEAAAPAAALPETLAVHFDPPAAPAAEPEAAAVYADSPAPEALAHETPPAEGLTPAAPAPEAIAAEVPSHAETALETPASVVEPVAEPAAQVTHAPEHIEVLTPETFDWQSLTHPTPVAEGAPAVAEPVAAEVAHAAPEALGAEALGFADHVIAPHAEATREAEHA